MMFKFLDKNEDQELKLYKPYTSQDEDFPTQKNNNTENSQEPENILNTLLLSKPESNESKNNRINSNNIPNTQTRDKTSNIHPIHPNIHFITKKKGRPKNSEENNTNRIHTKYSKDNVRYKICNHCNTSIYKFIITFKNPSIELHKPTIKKQIGKSKVEIKKFFEKKIYDIFRDAIPKRVKDDIKNNRESYQNNKDATNIIYNSKDEDDKTKILKGLFNLRFKDFLTAYLNDETEIKIFGDTIISLNGFKTYKDFIEEFPVEQKKINEYKKYILDMFN